MQRTACPLGLDLRPNSRRSDPSGLPVTMGVDEFGIALLLQ